MTLRHLIAEAIDLPEARNQVFNIGADEPCSLNELATLVAAAMDVRAEVAHLARAARSPPHLRRP